MFKKFLGGLLVFLISYSSFAVNFILLPQEAYKLNQQSENKKAEADQDSREQTATQTNAMVEAVHHSFKNFLKVFSYQDEFKSLSTEQQQIIQDVLKVATDSPSQLQASDDQSLFDSAVGGENRLMATSSQPGEVIWVNSLLIKDPAYQLSLPLLFQLMFHEYGHKTQHSDWGQRDLAARFFSDFISNHTHVTAVGEDVQFIHLSVPANAVDRHVEKVKFFHPQPTNLFLVQKQGVYQNLTDMLVEHLYENTSNAKSIMFDVYNMMFMALSPFTSMLVKFIQEFYTQMSAMFNLGINNDNGVDPKEFLDKMQEMVGSGMMQISLFEVSNVQSYKVNDELAVVYLNSSIRITRNMAEELPIKIDGIPFAEKVSVPLQFKVFIPLDSESSIKSENFQVSLSLEPDFGAEAEIVEIDEGSDETIIEVEVRDNEEITYATLKVDYGTSYLTLHPKSVSRSTQTEYSFQFVLPKFIENSQNAFFVDALYVNNKKSIPLNSIKKINKGNKAELSLKSDVQIVEDSAGIWAYKNNQPHLQKKFGVETLAFLFPPFPAETDEKAPLFIDPRQTSIEFKLSSDIKIKEVRFHVQQTLNILDVNIKEGDEPDEEKGNIQYITINGKSIPIATGGNLTESKDIKEIHSIPVTQIMRSETEVEGQQKVVATLQLGMNFIRDILPQEIGIGHHFPLIRPLFIEVITEDLQVLTYGFSERPIEDPSSCINSLFN